MHWKATHRIRFLPSDRSTAQEWDVMVWKDPYGVDAFVGVTEDEFERERPPQWRLSEGTWSWGGYPTPYGRPGLVEVIELSTDAQPSTLRYRRSRETGIFR